jgi:hypothetical protein
MTTTARAIAMPADPPYHFTHFDATGRRDLAAEQAAAEFRQQILEALQACKGYNSRRFRNADIDALAHWIALFERRPWTQRAVREARNLPFFRALFGSQWLKFYFGRGHKTRSHWTLMAWIIAGLTLEALQGADHLAGRPPRQKFGSSKGPVILFTARQLARIAKRLNEPPPGLETIRKSLNALKPPKRRRKRRTSRTSQTQLRTSHSRSRTSQTNSIRS